MRLQTAHCEWPIDSESQLRENLEALDERDEFAILSTGPECYIQTAVLSEGFIIEKREGSEAKHFHARRINRHPAHSDTITNDENSGWFARLFGKKSKSTVEHRVFGREEMVEVLVAYYLQHPSPDYVRWAEGY